MKTIEEALNIAYDECKSNAYFGNGFKKGVEYATNWNKINIDDIANNLLFCSTSCFITLFTKITGISPEEYRKC